jgi:hypothetical protein
MRLVRLLLLKLGTCDVFELFNLSLSVENSVNKTLLDLNIKTDPPAQFECLSCHKAIKQALLDKDPAGMYLESQSGPFSMLIWDSRFGQ